MSFRGRGIHLKYKLPLSYVHDKWRMTKMDDKVYKNMKRWNATQRPHDRQEKLP